MALLGPSGCGKSTLSFSTDLLQLDPDLWDYVIVHELLHCSIPNHGKLWEALMRAHPGDWESAAQRLAGSLVPREAAPSR